MLTVSHIGCSTNTGFILPFMGRGVAQAVEHSAVKVCILLHGRSILHDWSIFSLGYFPLVPQLVHQRLWYMLSYLWENAYIRFIAAYRKE